MNSKLRLALLAGCVATVSGAYPAQAGFQWTAPSPSSAMQAPLGAEVYIPRDQAPRPAAAPVAPVMSESLPQSMGQISSGAPVRTTPDGPANAAPVYNMSDDPVSWNQTHNTAPRAPQTIMPAEMPQQMVAAPIMQAPVMQSSSMYQIADGFGADLPLVMALRQIVPPQYGFSFDAGVNVSEHVSWQGGKPWDVVLQETVAPLGLVARINGNVVAVSRGNAPMGVQPVVLSGPQVVTETVQTATAMPIPVAPVVMQTPTAAPVMMQQAVATAGPVIAQPVANAAPDLGTTGTWTAPRNSSLRSILEDWSKRVNVELYWASEYDYPIQSAVSINGTYEEAVQVLLKGLGDSKPRPMGRLHPNLPNGPAVLIIETRQNSM